LNEKWPERIDTTMELHCNNWI